MHNFLTELNSQELYFTISCSAITFNENQAILEKFESEDVTDIKKTSSKFEIAKGIYATHAQLAFVLTICRFQGKTFGAASSAEFSSHDIDFLQSI